VSSGLGARRPRLEVAPRITPRVPRRNSGDGPVAVALERLRDCRFCARNLAGLGDDQGDLARSGCGPRAWAPCSPKPPPNRKRTRNFRFRKATAL